MRRNNALGLCRERERLRITFGRSGVSVWGDGYVFLGETFSLLCVCGCGLSLWGVVQRAQEREGVRGARLTWP